MNKLRGKNAIFKKKKGELSSLRAEHGVLSRTEEVLTQRNDEIDRKMVNCNVFQVFLCDVLSFIVGQISITRCCIY